MMRTKRIVIALVLSAVLLFSVACSGKNGGKEAVLNKTEYTYLSDNIQVDVKFNDTVLVKVLRADAEIDAANFTTVNGGLTLKMNYLYTLAAGTHAFKIVTTVNTLSFSVLVPESAPLVSDPTIAPAAAEIDMSASIEDASFTITYNGTMFEDLVLGGRSVNSSDYSINATKLILKKEFLATLSGENVFTLKTDGGDCTFKVTIVFSKPYMPDSEKIKAYAGADLSYRIDNGSGLTVLSINGVEVPTDAYSYSSNTLTLKNSYISALSDDVYTLVFKGDSGVSLEFAMVKGMDADEVFLLNFDGFQYFGNGYAQDLSINESLSDTDGVSAKLSTINKGTLLNFGADNIAYTFENNKKYSLYFEFSPVNIVEGTSSVLDIMIPVWFTTSSETNADLAYIRYTDDSGLYLSKDSASDNAELYKVAENTYAFTCDFTYKTGYKNLQAALWMTSEILFDNIRLCPVTGVITPTDMNGILIGQGGSYETDLGGVTVLGVNGDNGAAAASSYTVDGGKVTFKPSFFAGYQSDDVIPFTIVTGKGRVYGNFVYIDYDISVDGDSFRYASNGQDMSFTLSADGLTVKSIAADGKALTAADYTLASGALTFKAAFLDKIFTRTEIVISFNENENPYRFTLKSKLVYKLDFDSYLSSSVGYAVGASAEVVTSGIEGKSGKITVSDGAATMLAMGENFIRAGFEAGETYVMSYQFKATSMGTVNHVIPGHNLFMPFSFGGGKDVVYLFYDKATGAFDLSTQQIGTTATLTKDGDIYTAYIEFIPTQDCKNLTIDMWMDCVLEIDNFVVRMK